MSKLKYNILSSGVESNVGLFGKGLDIISCFPVEYREIWVKIFFQSYTVSPVKIQIFTFLLHRLIACA